MPFDPKAKLTKDSFKKLPPLCTDGAWGTEMSKLGGKPGEMKDFWNVDHPDRVEKVARSYVEAGSHIILTNTFNSNRIVLAKHESAKRAAELSQAGAAISKKAAAGKAYVFASIGPTGKMVMMGDISAEEAEEVFAEQAAALAAGGADALCVETQADLEEARAALLACAKVTKLPFGATFTFDSGKDKTATMMGVTPEKAYKLAQETGCSYIGANCGVGIESYITVAKLFAKCGKDIPIWIKGNAGLPEVDENGGTVYRGSPELFEKAVGPLLDAGARFIGGCCGSGPTHIRAMAQALKKFAK